MEARVSRCLLNRLEGLPKEVRDIAWKARVQLCARSRRLQAAGKHANVVMAATAREMLGFAWDIPHQGAVRALRRARQQLTGFLLRHGRVHSGKNWTLAHRRWLTTLRFEHPAQQIVLQDYIHAVEDAKARRDALMAQIEALLPRWSMAPLVEALQAMRGVALIVAVTLVAEVGDLTRFDNPRHVVTPAKAGVQTLAWISAFAGMT